MRRRKRDHKQRKSSQRRGRMVKRRDLRVESLEMRALLDGSPWHNSSDPMDVNDDSRVTPLDAAIVISDLNKNGPRVLGGQPPGLLAQTTSNSSASSTPSAFVDVNGDGAATPLDAAILISRLNTANLVGEEEVGVRLEITDTSDNPIDTATVGDDLLLKVFVQDLRADVAVEDLGLFSAYVDIAFDSTLVAIAPDRTGTFLDELTFGPNFGGINSGDDSVAGLIDDAGSSGSVGPPPGTADELLLFSVPIRADSAGLATFLISNADNVLLETNFAEPPSAVDVSLINYVSDSIEITAVPEPVDAVDDTFDVDEDSEDNPLDVLFNDDITTAGTLVITDFSTPDNGGTVVNNGDSLTYTPATDFFGDETFTYDISDGLGNTDTATVVVSVAPQNDDPIAMDDDFVTAEDSTNVLLDVLFNDNQGPDTSETLTITGFSTPDSGGQLVNNGSSLTYTPAADFFGTETFTYTVSDGNNGTAQATVEVEVTPLNDDPTANDDPLSVTRDTTDNVLNVLSNDSILPDAGETLTIMSVGPTDMGGTVTNTGTSLLYTPLAGFVGDETFTYTINDGNTGTATATVVVTVNDTGPLVRVRLEATDLGGTPITEIDFGRSYLVNAYVEDIREDVDPADLGVFSAYFDVLFDTSLASAVLKEIQQVELTGGPTGGTFSLTFGGEEVTGIAFDATASAVQSALESLSSIGVGNVTVEGIDGGPWNVRFVGDLAGIDVALIEGDGTSLTGGTSPTVSVIETSSVDPSDPLDFAAAFDFGDSYFNGTRAVNGADRFDDVGAFQGGVSPLGGDELLLFTVEMHADGIGVVDYSPTGANSPLPEIEIVLLAPPPPATVPNSLVEFVGASIEHVEATGAVNDTASVIEDSSGNALDVLANDFVVSGGTLSISAVGATSDGGIVVNNGTSLTYTPAADFFGVETFTYTIVDGLGGTDTATVSVTVTPTNDPPNAIDDLFDTILEDSVAVNLDVLDNDETAPDAADEVLTIISISATDNGGVVINNGSSLTYTPAADFDGVETFTYTIEDEGGLQDTATVTIDIVPVIDFMANDDELTVPEDSIEAPLDVLANDDSEVPSALQILSVGPTDMGGTVINDGDQLLYTPAPDFFGFETFTYTMNAGEGGESTATVTVEVTNVNDPPTANDDTFEINAQSTGNVLDVLFNDEITPDVGETLSISAVGTASNGGTIVNNGDTLTYSPAPDFFGPQETFTYTASDGNGGFSTATVTIDILIPPSSVTGFVYVDSNGDGAKSPVEQVLGGVEVRIQGTDVLGAPVDRVTYTAGDGSYTFDGLIGGEYTLTEIQPMFFLDGVDTPGSAGGTSDPTGDEIEFDLPVGVAATDYNFGELGLHPAYSSIWFYLASTPDSYVLATANPGESIDWFTFQEGWEGVADVEILLSIDLSTVDLTVEDVFGNRSTLSLDVATDDRVQLIAEADGRYAVVITGGVLDYFADFGTATGPLFSSTSENDVVDAAFAGL